MEWLKKIGASIDYIEDNLDGEISMTKRPVLPVAPHIIFSGFFRMLPEYHYQNTYAAAK